MKKSNVKVLIVDIETAPILAHVWGLHDQNVGLNQISKDWHTLAFAAKWLDDHPSKTIYFDQRNKKNIEDDKELLEKVWKLLDEAQVIITQNGKSFDIRKLNARFVAQGLQPTSSFKHIDVLRIARKHFAFTSNKLEYMTGKLNTKYKKLTKRKFSGFELWKECLAGNKQAWAEMEKYNKYDVLSLEELYKKLIPWDNSINFGVYSDEEDVNVCTCGSTSFLKRGFIYTATGKFQRLRCNKCGSERRDSTNLFSKEKKKSLLRGSNG